MKYVVILGDGMADYPSKIFEGRTPLEVANKPNIDDLCMRGLLGLVKTVPNGMKPGSDVANLSMMGYAPDKYYTGRSPLEALSIGIDLKDTDLAIRCNLVTLSDEENYADKTMLDYSAGEISTAEAKQLIEHLQKHIGDEYLDFYAGVSYRHCLVAHNAEPGTDFTPPHDISDKKIAPYLPKGEYGDIFFDIMMDSYALLKDHPINKKRMAKGLKPANSIWLWGEGTRPMLTPFEDKYGINGAVISAVDLIKGIGKGAKMKVIDVEGATGTYNTNFKGKAKAAIAALKDGYDYVYIHMEAPDECGHQGDAENKVKSIELIDSLVVKYVKEQLDRMNEDYKILIAPDHPTPLSLKTHTSDPVPFIIYSHKAGEKQTPAVGKPYSEENGRATGVYFDSGDKLMDEFLYGEINSNAQFPQADCADIVNSEINSPKKEKKKNTKKKNKQPKNNKKKQNESNEQDEQYEQYAQDEQYEQYGQYAQNEPNEQAKPAKSEKKRASKGTIALVTILCLAVVLSAILVPLVFFHAPRIFVKNAEGFKAENIKSSKTNFEKYFFVLDNNISCDSLTFDDTNLHSIDLNKHTLEVSEKLEINTGKSGTLYIGTRKDKSFVTNNKSNLKAGEIVINAPNLDVVIMANISCENISAKAKTLTLYNFEGEETNDVKAQINAEKVIFAGNVNDAKSTSQFKVVNCTNVVVESNVKISNTISLVNSDLTLKRSGSIFMLQLDDNSTAIVEGAVTNNIQGGKQVIMKEGHACPTYKDVKTLVIFRKLTCTHSMTNCEKIIYVEKLAKPMDIVVEEIENKIYCKVAKVNYAAAYEFVVSDGENEILLPLWEKNTTDDPEYEITQYISTPGKSYTVKVTPKGNYSKYEDTLDFSTVDSQILYADGESISINYNYTVTLAKPTGLRLITNENDDSTTTTLLEFNKVPQANAYKIFIDNQEVGILPGGETNRLQYDVTQFVGKVGDHCIKVQAINTGNSNIKDSPFAMIANYTTEKLKGVTENTLKATISETTDKDGKKSAAIQASWDGVQNGFEYLIELQINDSTKITIGRTSIITADGKVEYSINFDDLKDIEYDSSIAESTDDNGYRVIVTALGHGYYSDSNSASCKATIEKSPSELTSPAA